MTPDGVPYVGHDAADRALVTQGSLPPRQSAAVLPLKGGRREALSFVAQTCVVYNLYMRHIGVQLKQTRSRLRTTERGELMRYFCDHLNASRIRDNLPPITMARMGKILEQIPTKDLYYLKRVCDDSKNFSKRFWYELDPEKHTEDARKK